MLCNLLKQIYLNDIHKSLSSDEYQYSVEVKQTFLDLWNQPNNTKTHPDYPNSVFYMKNNEYLFELFIQIDDLGNKKQYLYCHYDRVWSIFESKYGMQYSDIQQFIKNVVENTLKMGSVTPDKQLLYTPQKVENTLKKNYKIIKNENYFTI